MTDWNVDHVAIVPDGEQPDPACQVIDIRTRRRLGEPAIEVVDTVDQAWRRAQEASPIGRPTVVYAVEFTCGICGTDVMAYAKTDPFPSCLECRAWCAVDDGYATIKSACLALAAEVKP